MVMVREYASQTVMTDLTRGGQGFRWQAYYWHSPGKATSCKISSIPPLSSSSSA
jgi:hypothetical protein